MTSLVQTSDIDNDEYQAQYHEEEVGPHNVDEYQLDEDDLREIHILKRQERPHLVAVGDFYDNEERRQESNVWVKYDLQLWREEELCGEVWEVLKKRLRGSVGLGREVDIVENDNLVREKVAGYESGNKPVLIRGVMDSWTGYSAGSLTFKELKRRFPQIPFRFSDTHGGMLDLETYGAYCVHPLQGLSDDSPLAVYDSEFGDDEITRGLLEEYEVPNCFGEDLFQLADETESTDEDGGNPPYRWILCGPARSGTGLHIDPLLTSAWVALVEGLKLWCLFPRGTDAGEIGVRDGETGVQVSSSIWFKDYYWRFVEGEEEKNRPYVVLQKPGEVVYVPSGWYHLVLNMEHSTAVTHNFAEDWGEGSGRIEEIWKVVKKEERDFAKRWIKGLKEKRPDLAKRILVVEEE